MAAMHAATLRNRKTFRLWTTSHLITSARQQLRFAPKKVARVAVVQATPNYVNSIGLNEANFYFSDRNLA